jgi:hypothetical protein
MNSTKDNNNNKGLFLTDMRRFQQDVLFQVDLGVG